VRTVGVRTDIVGNQFIGVVDEEVEDVIRFRTQQIGQHAIISDIFSSYNILIGLLGLLLFSHFPFKSNLVKGPGLFVLWRRELGVIV